MILRRIDAVAHEDDGSVYVDGRRTGLVLGQVVFAVLQVDGRATGRNQGKAGLIDLCVHGHERDLLKIGSILARGPGAGQSELGGDVFCRQLAPSRTWAASLQQIAGQKADVSTDLLRIDACSSLARSGWDAGDCRHLGHRRLLGLQSKPEQSRKR